MSTSVVFPPRAAKALGYLKSAHNDVEIFVEDSSAPNMWVKLLKIYLPNAVRLNTVNVLGPRQNVLDACNADQIVDDRKKLYIIDGDLDHLRGIGKPRLKHLYRLRSYCVENYLITDAAFVSVITTLDAHVDAVSAAIQFDLEAWFVKNEAQLRTLFVCYAVVYELASELQTVKFSVHKLIDGRTKEFDLCEKRVFSRVYGLYRAVRRKVAKESVREVFERCSTKAEALGARRYASGKDYILPQLHLRMKAMFKANVDVRRLKMMLAGSQDAFEDAYLLRRVRAICK